MKGRIGILYMKLCSSHGFRGDQCRESHTLIGGMNEADSILLPHLLFQFRCISV